MSWRVHYLSEDQTVKFKGGISISWGRWSSPPPGGQRHLLLGYYNAATLVWIIRSTVPVACLLTKVSFADECCSDTCTQSRVFGGHVTLVSLNERKPSLEILNKNNSKRYTCTKIRQKSNEIDFYTCFPSSSVWKCGHVFSWLKLNFCSRHTDPVPWTGNTGNVSAIISETWKTTYFVFKKKSILNKRNFGKKRTNLELSNNCCQAKVTREKCRAGTQTHFSYCNLLGINSDRSFAYNWLFIFLKISLQNTRGSNCASN